RLARAAELDEVPVRLRVRLLQMADAGLRDLPLGNLVERELDGLVAVGLLGLELDHGAWAGLDHRHRRHLTALLVEELGHSEFSAPDPLHRLQLDLDAAPG